MTEDRLVCLQFFLLLNLGIVRVGVGNEKSSLTGKCLVLITLHNKNMLF